MTTQYAKREFLTVVAGALLFLIVFTITYADTTIGTNMSTTGTLLVNPSSNSATSVRFQNAAGTNYFIADSTNSRIGIGAAPSTVFEVQGTASASYFFTANSLQVGGSTFATVSYSRFGTGATGHSLTAVDDVLFTGLVEFDDNAFFDAKASVSGNFQTSGRFIADTAASHSFRGNLNITKTIVVGSATASGSGAYISEFVGATTGTASFYFGGGDSATRGSCFQLKSTTGAWIYMRFTQGATTPTLSAVRCH